MLKYWKGIVAHGLHIFMSVIFTEKIQINKNEIGYVTQPA